MSHISRPATTDHWAKVLPLKAEVPPLSLGIVRMRIRPTLDQWRILHACKGTHGGGEGVRGRV